jgi:hypothetical protein
VADDPDGRISARKGRNEHRTFVDVGGQELQVSAIEFVERQKTIEHATPPKTIARVKSNRGQAGVIVADWRAE